MGHFNKIIHLFSSGTTDNSSNKHEINGSNRTDPSTAHLTLKNGLDETIINRELLTKMMALSEIIKNLQDENHFLKTENNRITVKTMHYNYKSIFLNSFDFIHDNRPFSKIKVRNA